MRKGSVEISIYQPPSAADAPESMPSQIAEAPTPPFRSPRPSLPRAVVSPIAATVAIALHALLVTSMMWSAGPEKPHSDPRTPGAWDTDVPETADDGALQVFLFDEPSVAASSAERRNSSKSANSLRLPPIPLVQLDEPNVVIATSSSDDESSSANSSPDTATRSAMYGRYLGQISARINRAWLRPRTAIGAPMFSCRVRIDQDNRGNVQNVTLEDCNGDSRWQLSLVQAIESASPLPAPPDPSVFTRIVHANFVGRAYEPGLPEAQYEPGAIDQAIAAAAAPHANERALRDFGQSLRKSEPRKVISLTLSGPGDGQQRSTKPRAPINQGDGAESFEPEGSLAPPPGAPNP
jgi:hypothetical protein